jgi:Domain of unknown function (DUF4062)
VKVFLSSVIGGMEEFRAAAREGGESLGHTVTAAEDFGASPLSPQQVCLTGVRQADVVVLLLGSRYGAVQPSGLSPTHEEYRAARGSKPVLVFVQEGVTPEPGQDTFVKEVSGWEDASYRQSFDTPAALRAAVTRALHQWELSQQAGPVDEQELAARTARLLPKRAAYAAGSPALHLVVAGAPAQQLLRPGDLDDPELRRDMEREALYGQQPVFDTGQGVQAGVQGTTLAIRQANAEITLDEDGSIRISRPARDTAPRGRIASGISSLVEEDVRDRIAAALRYTGWLLDHIDGSHRLTRVGLACRLDGIGYMPWRTREEVAASPNQASISMTGIESADSPPVILPRVALLFDGTAKAEDITVRFRRQAGR